jgi:hypothetical protein
MINNVTHTPQINVNTSDFHALRNNRHQSTPDRPTSVEDNLQIVDNLWAPNIPTGAERVEGVNSLLFEPIYENGQRADTRMRGIGEMARIVEEELNRLEGNTELSDEERAAERSRIENTFVRAIRMQGIRSNDHGGFAMTASDAEAHVQNAANHAFGIMQNVGTFSNDPRIQELINQGMNDFLEFSIRRATSSVNFAQRFTASGDDVADAARWNNITNETDNLRRGMQDMIENMREQMMNMTRIFAMPHQPRPPEMAGVNILL